MNYDQLAGYIISLGKDPAADCRILQDGKGGHILEQGSWKVKDVPEPTPDVVATFVVLPPDPDKEKATSLEKGAYKELIAQCDVATTVVALRTVLRTYLAKKAGE